MSATETTHMQAQATRSSAEPTTSQTDIGAHCAVTTGWVLGTILTKQDGPYGITQRQIIGYQYATSKDAAVGKFVTMTHERNPGFSLGEIITMELPPARQEAPNKTDQT